MAGDARGGQEPPRHVGGAEDDRTFDGCGAGPQVDDSLVDEPSGNISVEHIQAACLEKGFICTAAAPLDRVKFIMQCQRELQRSGVLETSFGSSWQCFRGIASTEGVRSFWRGNLIQVAALLPTIVTHVFIGGPTQRFVYNNFPLTFPFGQTAATYTAVLCGALAVSMVSYPLDFARFRLAVDMKSGQGLSYDYRHSLAFFAQPIFSESPHLLYTGIGLYVLGSVMYGMLHTAMVQLVLPRLPAEVDGYDAFAAHVGTGLGASAVSTLGLHPVDTVRRRMMIAVTRDDLRYNSARHCLSYILLTEGLMGLYRGATFTLVRMSFVSSLSLAWAVAT
uniref:ADP/ATP translocase n=1 Tax=Trypanosoma congolense (strain IL3000) TaxID=1068625 RepID=G0UR89_TRYCI|nr:putative ADP/ATP mitochondrial translocase [Trypanosoma congolense IL3000]